MENKTEVRQLVELPPQALEVRLAEKINDNYVKHYLIPISYLMATGQTTKDIEKLMSIFLKEEVRVTRRSDLELKSIPDISAYLSPIARNTIRNLKTEKGTILTNTLENPILIKGDSIGQNTKRLVEYLKYKLAQGYMAVRSKFFGAVGTVKKVYAKVTSMIPFEVVKKEQDEDFSDIFDSEGAFIELPIQRPMTFTEKVFNFMVEYESANIKTRISKKLLEFAVSFESSDLEDAIAELNVFVEDNSELILSKLADPKLILLSDTVGDGKSRYVLYFPFHTHYTLTQNGSGLNARSDARFYCNIGEEGAMPKYLSHKVGVDEIQVEVPGLASEFNKLMKYGTDF